MRIELNQVVNLTFSLKYLVNFARSAALSNVVQLMMSNDVPLLVSSHCFALARLDLRIASRSHTSLARATFATTSRPRSATTRNLLVMIYVCPKCSQRVPNLVPSNLYILSTVCQSAIVVVCRTLLPSVVVLASHPSCFTVP